VSCLGCCLRTTLLPSASCKGAAAYSKKALPGGLYQLTLKVSPHSCLDRSGNNLQLKQCDPASSDQQWAITGAKIGSADGKQCLDTLGATGTGKVGLYECHGEGSQQWTFQGEGIIKNTEKADVCLGWQGTITQSACTAGQDRFRWEYSERNLRPYLHGLLCLQRNGNSEPKFEPCDVDEAKQKWVFASNT